MNLKHVVRSGTAGLLAAAMICSHASTASAATKSADVISVALGEVGATEGPNEYSKYGKWYGLPNSYWCDMFVSWCAMKGGIPTSQFPRHCSCTEHVRRFSELGRYQASASRGGSYVPQQGDAIFFYNNVKYPSGSVKNHTGLVLYVEDGYVYTIEGNALANRLDIPYSVVGPARDDSLEPPDYVTVNRYPLDEARIHGYGTPAYDDRTALPLSGFVDLGRHAGDAAVFQAVHDAGVMPATSSHTFSPNHGMTRGDFLELTTSFFGLSGWEMETASFDDVPAESEYYASVMSARSAGFIQGAVENTFLPDRYITPSAAQAVLNRAMAYVGLEEQEFSFSRGDYSYIVSSYTIRADIAKAFYALCQKMPLTDAFEGEILIDGTAFDGQARLLNGVCYVPVTALVPEEPSEEGDGTADGETSEEENEVEQEEKQSEEEESVQKSEEDSDKKSEEESEKDSEGDSEEDSEEDSGEDPEEDSDEEASDSIDGEKTEEPDHANEAASGRLPVPMGNTDRVIPAAVTLQTGETTADVDGFTYRGTPYVALQAAADLLSVDVVVNP